MVSIDYELLEAKMAMLVAKDKSSSATLAYDCGGKGPSDERVVLQLARDWKIGAAETFAFCPTASRPGSHCNRLWPRPGAEQR